MRRNTLRYAFALIGLVTFGSAGQPAAQQSRQARTPERGADLHTIQFVAVAEDGTPITDLRPEEVKIRIGNRDRDVRSLQLITFDLPAGESIDIPPPFGTNAVAAQGRTFALAIDQDSFRPGLEGPLRTAVDSLLSQLGPGDAVALLALPYGGVKVPFTSDRTQVQLAMSRLVGQAPANETANDLACRTGRTLEGLTSFLEGVGVRQESMTVVFFTSALAGPRRTVVRDMRLAGDPQGSGMCELSENKFARVGTVAGAARARFYVVRPGDAADKGLAVQREGALGSDHPLAGIEHLAGVTRGKLLALTGSVGNALERVARENSAYYSASVDSEAGDFNAREQPLGVRVSRDGVEVRSAPSITFATDPSTAKFARPSMRDMMGTLRVFRDLPMRAAGFPALASEGQNVRVVVLAEPVEPDVKVESMMGALFDADGKVVAQWTATADELQRQPVMGAISAPAGAYRLRVAAIDSTGRAGTADYDVTAEVVRTGPLRLSSLVLGLSRGGGFVPRMQFINEPLAVAYVELEGAAAGSRLNAALEISETANGPALVSVPLALESAGENRYRAMGSVPMGALPPGDYVARAMIGLEGHPMTRVVRTFRKAVLATKR